jgi:hypothetical protein
MPAAAVICCTADRDKVDDRTRSKWSRVLRYAAEYKDLDEPLRDFIKCKGGINKCASRFARRLGQQNWRGYRMGIVRMKIESVLHTRMMTKRNIMGSNTDAGRIEGGFSGCNCWRLYWDNSSARAAFSNARVFLNATNEFSCTNHAAPI